MTKFEKTLKPILPCLVFYRPAYMAISRFFDRWNAEEEEYIESIRRQHKTENDIRRAAGRLQEDEEPIRIEVEEE